MGKTTAQEQCREQMHIARATVQQIVDSARKKIFVSRLWKAGHSKFSGGEYRLCEGGAACAPAVAARGVGAACEIGRKDLR